MLYWDSIPWEQLPGSIKIDFASYLLSCKNAVRFCSEPSYLAIDAFYNMKVPGFLRVFQGMVYIANDQRTLDRLIEADNDNLPHEVTLGRILRYPKCCTEKIGVLGENCIDDYNREFNEKVERHSLLDISQYSNGIGLISHVPCSTSCKYSKRLAYQFYQSLKKVVGSQNFCLWRDEIVNYFFLIAEKNELPEIRGVAAR